jgi:hypothetical protein
MMPDSLVLCAFVSTSPRRIKYESGVKSRQTERIDTMSTETKSIRNDQTSGSSLYAI